MSDFTERKEAITFGNSFFSQVPSPCRRKTAIKPHNCTLATWLIIKYPAYQLLGKKTSSPQYRRSVERRELELSALPVDAQDAAPWNDGFAALYRTRRLKIESLKSNSPYSIQFCLQSVLRPSQGETGRANECFERNVEFAACARSQESMRSRPMKPVPRGWHGGTKEIFTKSRKLT